MREIEILAPVFSDKNTVLKKLKKFDYKGVFRVLDIYYYDPKRPDLRPNNKGSLKACFRLRSKNNKFFMAYKADNFDKNGKWVYSDEHEIEVSDLRTAENIVEHLGLKQLVEIDNRKHVFLSKDYEIVFEEVRGLGCFLEVEKLKAVDDKEIKKIKKEIWRFIESLNIKVGEELNLGKPELMLRRK